MKKLLFTAITVLAFSGVSMAGNLVKDDAEKVTNKKTLVTSDTDCLVAKFVAYNDARAEGLSAEAARSASYSVYFTCMSLPPAGQY